MVSSEKALTEEFASSPLLKSWYPLQSPVPAISHRAPFTSHSARMEQCKKKTESSPSALPFFCYWQKSREFVQIRPRAWNNTQNTAQKLRESTEWTHRSHAWETSTRSPSRKQFVFKPETKSGRKTVLFTQNAKNINVSDDISHYNSDFFCWTRRGDYLLRVLSR